MSAPCSEPTTLVLGATGSFGGAVARELLSRGHPIRVLARDAARAQAAFRAFTGVEITEGDARDPGVLCNAAFGCGLIVHGVNYPYHRWIPAMEEVTDAVSQAAAGTGTTTTVLFPGNVYGLGQQTDGPLTEDALNRAATRKGRLRMRLEAILRQGAETGQFRTLIIRAGDYFGPTVRNGMVDPIFANAAAGRPMVAFGDLGVPHQWAYMPDLARATVELLAIQDRLRAFEVVHFAGHIAEPARSFYELVAQAAGKPDLRVRNPPWWAVRAAGLVNASARELVELRYLWDEAVILSGEKLRSLVPGLRQTPLRDAITETLASYKDDPSVPAGS